MKTKLVQIAWHTNEPIFSVDFHPSGKLATCGGDNVARIWSVSANFEIKLLSNLQKHIAPVNVVRFSPNGQYLASGSDDGFIMIWRLDEAESFKGNLMASAPENEENWVVQKAIHANKKDVYDLCWSPCSGYIVTGSTDNSTAIWKIDSHQPVNTMNDHVHFVQGVAWDPLDKFIATQSSDRTCKLYSKKATNKDFSNTTTLKYCDPVVEADKSSTNSDAVVTNVEPHSAPKRYRMFLSDAANTFFRRLCWSPDGLLLFTPCSLFSVGDGFINTTYVWSRNNFTKPISHLPCGQSASTIIKCSSVLYQLKKDQAENVSPAPWIDLEYRVVFAVATKLDLLIYDTQHTHPIARISNMHVVSITDIAWSKNGKMIAVSSRDAYCSFISFENDELGTPFVQVESAVLSA